MEWTKGWRERVWNEVDQPWDLLIIGGGITGAGILRQAVHAGLHPLLVEADDFASGTSSRSSKMVHGGLRYLKNAQIKVTLESVREREHLLKQGRGLINRLGFLQSCLEGDQTPRWFFGAGLVVYDIMAGQWSHRSYRSDALRELCPQLTAPALRGGYRFFDACTDDARLVLRLLREAVSDGGLALNYARVDRLLRTRDGQVCGGVLRDTSGEMECEKEVRAKVVINATGAWADRLRATVQGQPRLRPLRGSHFIMPFERLPLTRAVSFFHPRDGRAVFAAPWEGAILFGTTDVDHGNDLVADPSISAAEADYLLEGLQFVFPGQELTRQDVTASFSGLRPVINTGKADPSKESREHAIWDDNGLLTVTGGKLTTFRIMARDALKAARTRLGSLAFDPHSPILDALPPEADSLFADSNLPAVQQLRLLARYGVEASGLLADGASQGSIPGTPYLWAELRQAAHAEGAIHLDDLLLRRLRVGLLLPRGGTGLLAHIRAIVQSELGWDDSRWDQEAREYRELWQRAYCLN